MQVSRQWPWASLAWIAAGLLAVMALYALGVVRGWKLSGLPVQAVLVVSLFTIPFVAMAIIHLATVWDWLAGPRFFILGSAGFEFGARSIHYQDIAYLQHNYGNDFTDVGLHEGGRIRLRWPIWAESEEWIAVLSDRTGQRLRDDAWRRLQRGEELDFGKKLRLNLRAVIMNDRHLPIGDIAFVGSLSGNDMGTDYRTLRVGSLGKTTEIDLSKVRNPHVFFDLLQMLINHHQSGKSS